jgi:two-component system OmpR family response regulator
MAAGVRVLVVDDEPSIVDAVATALGYAGFTVAVADSGEAALAAVAVAVPEVIVLDIMMPGMDGVSVCRTLRARGVDSSVLFLTARDDVADKVTGLRAGGDDYVVKPFALAEVVARVQAMARRRGTDPEPPTVLSFADVRIDLQGHQVFRAGTQIPVTATEFRLLEYFVRHPRRILSKEQILDAVWPEDFDGPVNIVETYVGYLRRKLNEHGPPLIRTTRLVGYVLREPVD